LVEELDERCFGKSPSSNRWRAKRVFPYEEAIVRERMNVGTFIGKLLIIRREWIDGRITVVLVREPVGV